MQRATVNGEWAERTDEQEVGSLSRGVRVAAQAASRSAAERAATAWTKWACTGQDDPMARGTDQSGHAHEEN
ncbi:hypothetical protein RRF57_005385 [Xylaria bambusicola]|uniref:Uncharacterized protein n=1 Tax=Xylaria bambusicola TaxID=326684 RepID=A0AAN7UCF0_9PEZI